MLLRRDVDIKESVGVCVCGRRVAHAVLLLVHETHDQKLKFHPNIAPILSKMHLMRGESESVFDVNILDTAGLHIINRIHWKQSF